MQGAKLQETLKNYCANGKRDYNRLTLFLDHCCRLHHVRTMNFILQRNMIEQILKRLRSLGFFIESISTELSTSDVLDNCKKINAFIQFPLDISSHKIFFSRFDFSLAPTIHRWLSENVSRRKSLRRGRMSQLMSRPDRVVVNYFILFKGPFHAEISVISSSVNMACLE